MHLTNCGEFFLLFYEAFCVFLQLPACVVLRSVDIEQFLINCINNIPRGLKVKTLCAEAKVCTFSPILYCSV
uniref:Secreted protein n=1 Tax=Anguilla anguilla TaxID=7936 RepID=A0A0E9S1R3_ANGAN